MRGGRQQGGHKRAGGRGTSSLDTHSRLCGRLGPATCPAPGQPVGVGFFPCAAMPTSWVTLERAQDGQSTCTGADGHAGSREAGQRVLSLLPLSPEFTAHGSPATGRDDTGSLTVAFPTAKSGFPTARSTTNPSGRDPERGEK